MRYQSSPSQDVRAGDRSCYSETNRDVAIVCILSSGDLFGHMVKDHSFPCDDCFCDVHSFFCCEIREIFAEVNVR